MTLYVFPEMNLKVTIEKNKISIFDNFTEKSIYTFDGVFIFKVLGDYDFMVLEKCNRDKFIDNSEKHKLNFFKVQEDGRISINTFCIRPNALKLNKNLLLSKEIIIPGLYKDFIYSVEFGRVMSDFFSRITFDEEEQQFHVEDEVLTSMGPITLQGVLNIDGFLLNESMYSKELHEEFYINPFDKDSSIYKLYDRFEKLLKRKAYMDYARNLLNYERDCYLTRKRRIAK